MRKSMHLARGLAILMLVHLAAAGLRADPPPKPAPGMGVYIMVLWPPGAPIPGDPNGRVKNLPEPDVAKLGGKVLFSMDSKRVIMLPLAAANGLRHHEAVVYLQRIWMGEPLAGWDESFSWGTHRLVPKAEGDENLQWGPKAYDYDGSGNIKTIGPDSYKYDSAGRLIQATVNNKTENYSYDAFGNLVQKAVAGANPVTIAMDSSSNRMAGLNYDAAGNVTVAEDGRRTYKYDSVNMLTRAATTGIGDHRMIYDAGDERIGTMLDRDTSRWTIRDFEGRIIREYKGDSSGYWTWEEDYFYGEGSLMGGDTQPWGYQGYQYGGRRHYHLDHLGSVRMVTNDAHRSLSEHEYYPFGTTMTRTYQEQLNSGDMHIDAMRFAGHWRDFLGLLNVDNTEYIDYMHARHYDPNLGRFLSVDPNINVERAVHSPQLWNRYAYVGNNPMAYVDPDGKEGVYKLDMFRPSGETPLQSFTIGLGIGGVAAAIFTAPMWVPAAASAIPAFGSAAATKFLSDPVGTTNLANEAISALTPGPGAGMPLSQFERATVQLANELRFTTTTLQHMKEAERMVPRSILAQSILTGSRSADPQGAAGAIQITQNISRAGKDYVLRIIYREKDHMILHFQYAAVK